MAELEEGILENYPTTPMLWKHCINDIPCIWPGTQESLEDFIKYFDRYHSTIKFTHESSLNEIQFLDVTIHKGESYRNRDIPEFKPFFKKTNQFQYLHYSSAHPKQTFQSVLKGEQPLICHDI